MYKDAALLMESNRFIFYPRNELETQQTLKVEGRLLSTCEAVRSRDTYLREIRAQEAGGHYTWLLERSATGYYFKTQSLAGHLGT